MKTPKNHFSSEEFAKMVAENYRKVLSQRIKDGIKKAKARKQEVK